MAVQVNEELCVECGKCMKACRVGAIALRIAEAGPAEERDPRGRPERASRPHGHRHGRHLAGLVEHIRAHLFEGRGRVHRAH